MVVLAVSVEVVQAVANLNRESVFACPTCAPSLASLSLITFFAFNAEAVLTISAVFAVNSIPAVLPRHADAVSSITPWLSLISLFAFDSDDFRQLNAFNLHRQFIHILL